MIRTHIQRTTVVALLAAFIVTTVAVALPPMTDAQKTQLRLNALKALNSAVANVKRKIDYRLSFLDPFLKNEQLMGEFLKYRTKKEASATTQPDAPKRGDWSDSAAEPSKGVPLTFADALELATHMELETGLQKAMSTTTDISMLLKQEQSLEAISRKNFDAALAGIIDVEYKIDFLKETERWDAFMEWAGQDLERRDLEEADRKQAMHDAADQRERDRQAALAQREAEKEQRERERAEKLEERWQRKVEAYQLQTERVRAMTPQSVSYGGGRRWWY